MPTVTYIGPYTDGVDTAFGHIPHKGSIEVPDASGFADQEDFTVKGTARPSVKDVLSEVGDDPVKAGAALEVENAHPNPRKGVIDPLTALIEGA